MARKGEKEKQEYSQPPLMDRHNRGDLREEGEKKKTAGEPGGSQKVERKLMQIRTHATGKHHQELL